MVVVDGGGSCEVPDGPPSGGGYIRSSMCVRGVKTIFPLLKLAVLYTITPVKLTIPKKGVKLARSKSKQKSTVNLCFALKIIYVDFLSFPFRESSVDWCVYICFSFNLTREEARGKCIDILRRELNGSNNTRVCLPEKVQKLLSPTLWQQINRFEIF